MASGDPQTLYVAHYGHVKLPGAKHWSFLYYGDDVCPMALQVTGSTTTYSAKSPERIQMVKSETYLGKVAVGRIPSNAYDHMVAVVQRCSVVHGNLCWNCRNWIIEALKELERNGHDVQTPTKEELLLQLAVVDKNS